MAGSSTLADNPEERVVGWDGVGWVVVVVVVRFLIILLPKGPASLPDDGPAAAGDVDACGAGLARTGMVGAAELSVKFPSSNCGLKKMVSSGNPDGDGTESAGLGGRPASSILKRTIAGGDCELETGRKIGRLVVVLVL